jgi:hypothetical protein
MPDQEQLTTTAAHHQTEKNTLGVGLTSCDASYAAGGILTACNPRHGECPFNYFAGRADFSARHHHNGRSASGIVARIVQVIAVQDAKTSTIENTQPIWTVDPANAISRMALRKAGGW